MAFVPRPHPATVVAVAHRHRSRLCVDLHLDPRTGWASTGLPDEWVHLWVPPPGSRRSAPDDPTRLLTVAAVDRLTRPGQTLISLEISLHSTGPAALWASAARPGDELLVSQPVGRHRRPEDAGWAIVLADHAGLPAAARIIAEAPAALRIIALLEVDDRAAQPELSSAAELDLRWFHRPDLTLPSALPSALPDLPVPQGPGYLWMGAEAAPAREVRRRLRQEWRWGPGRYAIAGYWQRRDDDYRRRFDLAAARIADLYAEQSRGDRDPQAVADDLDALLDRYDL